MQLVNPIELSQEQVNNPDALNTLLIEQGVITSISMEWKGKHQEGLAVEGKTLLDAMGISYTDKSLGSCLSRVVKQNELIEDTDFIKVSTNEFHSYNDVRVEKVSPKAVSYIFTSAAAVEAILSAHTDKGKTARKGIIKKVVVQTEAIEAKDTALTAIKDTSNEEQIKELADAGLTGEIKQVMLMARPARRLAKALEVDDGVSLPVKVEEILTASYNNNKATYEDRIRTAKSLRETVKKFAEAYIIKNVSNGMKLNMMVNERSEADNLILKYERKLARQAKTLAESKLTIEEN